MNPNYEFLKISFNHPETWVNTTTAIEKTGDAFCLGYWRCQGYDYAIGF